MYRGSNYDLFLQSLRPLHGVFMGVVERVGQNNGQIYVAVQNYQELEELSDVRVSNPQNNDLLAWNAASNRWENTTIDALGISGGLLTNELDPVFVAASNSFYPRTNPSNFITIASLSGYATGTPLYAFTETDPTAITNVTASGRITATKTDKQVALTFDASGLATGTPIYSVAGLATGTPLYVETDTIATNRLTNYYTIAAADAKFATGSPIYSVAGLATGTPLYAFAEADPIYSAASNVIFTRLTAVELYTNRAASALSSSVWASADSTTNYASRITLNSTSNSFNTRLGDVESYTNRAASALASSVWASADSTTNYALRTTFNSTSNSLNTRLTAVEGYTNRAAGALQSNTWAVADSTTNYASRVIFNATSNALNSSITSLAARAFVYSTNLSTIAGSGLGVVSNRLAVTNGFATTNMLANYLALTGGTMTASLKFAPGIGIDPIASIVGNDREIDFVDGKFSGNWVFDELAVGANDFRGFGSIAANTFYGSAANLTSFPSSLLTVSAGNANYWRITTAPTGATASGSSGQMAVSGTNLFIYSPNALGVGTARWLRVNAEANW